MSRALRSFALALACLSGSSLASSGMAESYELECELMEGIRSIRLSGPAGVPVTGRPTGESSFVVEVASARLPGLVSGDQPCSDVARLRVIPGAMLGTSTSRIVVSHTGTQPRFVADSGRARLTWLPGDVAARNVTAIAKVEKARERSQESSQARGRGAVGRASKAPAQRPAPSAPTPSPEAEAMARRVAELERQVASQADENSRLRQRLGSAPAAASGPPQRPMRQAPPPRPRSVPAPAPARVAGQSPAVPKTKWELKAERKAAERAEKQENKARKQALKAGLQPPPRSAPASAPAGIEGPPAGGTGYQVPSAQQPVAAPPVRHRVVVGEAGRAAAPQTLPPDFVAMSPATVMVATIPTDLRNGPGRRFHNVRRLNAGERVTVTGRAGDWYRVGAEGWAFASYLDAPAGAGGASSFVAVVNAVTAPVHAGPGGQHDVVAELYRGQRVVIDEVVHEWAHVRNGGWVRRSLLGEMQAR